MRSALRASLGESLITASVVMIMVVAVVGAALQLLVPLHLSSLGMDRTGIGLVYSVGAVLGAVAVVTTARVGDRVGRVPLAAAACAALAAPDRAVRAPRRPGGLRRARRRRRRGAVDPVRGRAIRSAPTAPTGRSSATVS